MSLYSIAAASLTTSADRRRRPMVNKGQVARTLLLLLLVSFVVAIGARAGHAAQSGEDRDTPRGVRAFVDG